MARAEAPISDAHRRLGLALREARERAGLSLRQLSLDASGRQLWDRSHLSRVEGGIKAPSPELIAFYERKTRLPDGHFADLKAAVDAEVDARRANKRLAGTRRSTILLDESGVSDEFEARRRLERGIFVQYANPEIMKLYGHNDLHEHFEPPTEVVRLTRLSLLLASGPLLVPASYLFEVKWISAWLELLRPARDLGMLAYVSPTPDVSAYYRTKKSEYPDGYNLLPESHEIGGLHWRPRVQRSTAADISSAWTGEIGEPNLLRPLFESLAGSLFQPRSYVLADLLQGRAAIARHILDGLPVSALQPLAAGRLELFLSQVYLRSYLAELGGALMVDTRLGDLDCELSVDSDLVRSECFLSARRAERLLVLAAPGGVRFQDLSISAVCQMSSSPFAEMLRTEAQVPLEYTLTEPKVAELRDLYSDSVRLVHSW